ncbi:hypothetical protein M422DRAFT_28287 [Sphaerobolus stellatus SS14]|nr:hypothetical protein M422DRAFT_28287 [Sphaerobolus stellatus SS14]
MLRNLNGSAFHKQEPAWRATRVVVLVLFWSWPNEQSMVTVQLSPGAGSPKVSRPILESFNEIKDFEKRLPQHRLTTTPETGFNGRVFLAWNEISFSIPRAIRRDIWEKHCPLKRRIILNVHDVNEELGLHKNSEGREILERWAEKLREMPDECVELGPHQKQIFDFDLWGTFRILSLYPSFATSPIMTSVRFSNVVLNAVERNTPVVTGISELDHSSAGNAYSTTLVIHVRRGDFDEHCINMATWAPGYNSWNLIPILVSGVSGIQRVMASRDITLETPPEKLASQAVDMEVAARAGLFLGNGFSSISANIVLLRLLRGLAADTCRLW